MLLSKIEECDKELDKLYHLLRASSTREIEAGVRADINIVLERRMVLMKRKETHSKPLPNPVLPHNKE